MGRDEWAPSRHTGRVQVARVQTRHLTSHVDFLISFSFSGKIKKVVSIPCLFSVRRNRSRLHNCAFHFMKVDNVVNVSTSVNNNSISLDLFMFDFNCYLPSSVLKGLVLIRSTLKSCNVHFGHTFMKELHVEKKIVQVIATQT